LDQEQGPEETQLDTDTSDKDPLAGFTIEDVKSVLAQVTDDVLVSIQVLSIDSVLTYFIIG
jgi:hypothetical protein